MKPTWWDDMRVTMYLTRVAQVLALVLLVIAVAPHVQALMRPKTPPTESMRAASRALPLFGASVRPPEAPAAPRAARDRLLAKARSLLGVPYEWGAKGPRTFDCSGFTKVAYAAAGVRLPDGSFNQAKGEQPLRSLSDLTPGNLLFYRWGEDAGVTHVTLYAGGGWAIGTGSPGQLSKVVVYPLASDLRIPGTIVTYRHVRLSDER
jgi:cell wall-associated NlpC family hydrolase